MRKIIAITLIILASAFYAQAQSPTFDTVYLYRGGQWYYLSVVTDTVFINSDTVLVPVNYYRTSGDTVFINNDTIYKSSQFWARNSLGWIATATELDSVTVDDKLKNPKIPVLAAKAPLISYVYWDAADSVFKRNAVAGGSVVAFPIYVDTAYYPNFIFTENTTGLVTDGSLQTGSVLFMGETTTPTAKADTGALYAKSTNALFFQDGGGTEHEVSLSGHMLGEMYMYAATRTITIDGSGYYNLIQGLSSGDLNMFTVDASASGAITVVANNGDGTLRITSASHTLTGGEIISIRGTTSYNSVYVITYVNANQFDITATWVADEPGSWDQGTQLVAGANTSGAFEILYNVSGYAALANKRFKWELFQNATELDKSAQERNHSTTDMGNISGGCFVTVAPGDRFSIGIYGVTDATDFVIEHGNVRIQKL